jgi:hypothetical protein
VLGHYGTDEAEAKYNAKIAEWLASGRVLKRDDTPRAGDVLTVNEVLLRYWRHAEQYYRRKDGTPTNELGDIRLSLRPVREMYGDLDTAKFTPLCLKSIRQRMITQPITTKIRTTDPTNDKVVWQDKVMRVGLARGVINSRIDRIRRAFRWAVSEDLIRETVYNALMTVDHLQAGRTEARETQAVQPVAEALVQDTLPFLSSTVADMVRLLMLTGARAGEIASMRGCDLDMTGSIWLFKLAHHKMYVIHTPLRCAVNSGWSMRGPALGWARFCLHWGPRAGSLGASPESQEAEEMKMNAKLSEEIAALAQMSGTVLRQRYAELFGDPTRVGNRAWLVRRIAWRLAARTHRPYCSEHLVDAGPYPGASPYLGLLLFNLQQRFRFGTEAGQLLVLRLVLLHPGHRLVIPLPRLVRVAEPPVGHGQEEPIKTIAALLECDRLL